MSNLLFCLQLSPVDAPAAVELANLIVEIENACPATCRPSWLISYRKDTPLIRVHEIEQKLCNYYDSVWLALAKEYASGWPAGSNAQWRSTMRDVAQLAQMGEMDCSGVLTFEPDCCPLRSDWIDRLDEAYANRSKPIVGNLHIDHINGNAMFPVSAIKDWPQILQTPPSIAWDYYHRELFLAQAEDTPFLTQLYRIKHLTRDNFETIEKAGERPALLHGIKDDSGRRLARDAFVKGTRAGRATRARTLPGTELPTKSRTQAL
jgi:hypothetical protein